MKRLFARFLAALLAATLLMTPAAMMEEGADVTLAVEAIEESEAAVDAGEADDATIEAEEIADPPIAVEDVDLIEDEVSADFAGEDFEAELPVETVSSPAMDYSGGVYDDGTASNVGTIPINDDTFPDPIFQKYVIDNYDVRDAEGNKTGAHDGMLSEHEILYAYDISLYGDFNYDTRHYQGVGITSLKGIEYLTNLQILECDGNALGSLDVSMLPLLNGLSCTDCGLATLDVSGCPELEFLDCHYNSLTALDISNCPKLLGVCTPEYKQVRHDDNGSVTKMYYDPGTDYCLEMDCDVDLIPFPGLKNEPVPVDASIFPDPAFRDYITENIDLDKNGMLSEAEQLGTLYIALCTYDSDTKQYNGALIGSLEGIRYFTELESLECQSNLLTSLDVSGLARLEYLGCEHSALTTLNVTGCISLRSLSCYANKLSSLDISDCAVILSHYPEKITNEWEYDGSGYIGFIDGPAGFIFDKKTDIIKEKAAPAPDPVPAPAPDPAPVVAEPAPVIVASAPQTILVATRATNSVITAAPGTTCQIDLAGATGKKFKSSNKKVATVNSTGQITVKKAGKTKITMTVNKKKRTLKLTIKDPTVPTSLTLTPAGPLTGKKGESVTLTPVLPENTNSDIKWKSSNKKVATVKNGVVVFKKPGKATITATCVRGKKKARVKVTVTR